MRGAVRRQLKIVVRHAVVQLGAAGTALDDQRFGHRGRRREARVERGRRVLMHELNPATQRAQRRLRKQGDILAIEHDAAGGDRCETQ